MSNEGLSVLGDCSTWVTKINFIFVHPETYLSLEIILNQISSRRKFNGVGVFCLLLHLCQNCENFSSMIIQLLGHGEMFIISNQILVKIIKVILKLRVYTFNYFEIVLNKSLLQWIIFSFKTNKQCFHLLIMAFSATLHWFSINPPFIYQFGREISRRLCESSWRGFILPNDTGVF